jgi:hypothetical protein
MHAVAYFNGNKDTSNSVFDVFCTVQVCLLNKAFIFYGLDHPFRSAAIPSPQAEALGTR